MPLRVGVGVGCYSIQWMYAECFHSDGYGKPQRHRELVYSSTSSEEKASRAQLLGNHLLPFYLSSFKPLMGLSLSRSLNSHGPLQL